VKSDRFTIDTSLATNELPRRSRQDSIEQPMLWLSPTRVIPLMAISIFVAEVCVMLLLYQLPQISRNLESLIDAGILLILLSPTIYYFHYRPLRLHYLARKSIIEQLLKSEEQLNLALSAVNDGLWDWNQAARQLYLSPRGLEILGYPAEQPEPDMVIWRELIHPEDRDQAVASLRQHLSGSSQSWESEYRLKAKNGDWIWVLARGQVVERDASGEPRRALGTFTDITTRKLAEEQLRQREIEIRQLSRQLMQSSEIEKTSIARDLHDDFNQVLTAFQFGVEMLKEHNYKNEEDYQFRCSRLLELTARLQADTRSICDKLRPVMLDDIGLVASLEWLVDQVGHQASAMQFEFAAKPLPHRLPNECEMVLYRVCQEALTNILKHAYASRVAIELDQTDYEITLRIRDNGRGFLPHALKKRQRSTDGKWGFGLLGMNERAAAIHGRVKIDSILGKGTVVEAVIPIAYEEGR